MESESLAESESLVESETFAESGRPGTESGSPGAGSGRPGRGSDSSLEERGWDVEGGRDKAGEEEEEECGAGSESEEVLGLLGVSFSAI